MEFLKRKCGAFDNGKKIFGCGKIDWFWKPVWETVYVKLKYSAGSYELGSDEDYFHYKKYTSLCRDCASEYEKRTQKINQEILISKPYKILRDKKEDEIPWALKQVVELDLIKEKYFFENLIESYKFGKFKIFYPDSPQSKLKWEKIIVTLESDSFKNYLKNSFEGSKIIYELIKKFENNLLKATHEDYAETTMNNAISNSIDYLKSLL